MTVRFGNKFGNQLAGTYTISGTISGRTTNMTGSAVIIESPIITPTFNSVSPICAGGSLNALPTTSLNNITGTWSPSSIITIQHYILLLQLQDLCATTQTMSITVNPVYAFQKPYSMCQGLTYSWRGHKSYNRRNIYSALFTNQGCDSVYTLTLSLYPAYNFNETHSICAGGSYLMAWSKSNDSRNLPCNYLTVHGCDQYLYITLIVNPVFAFTENHSICNGDSYLWHSQNLTTPGTYHANYSTVHGCDSTYTLTLTVNPVYVFTENHSICNGDSYYGIVKT